MARQKELVLLETGAREDVAAASTVEVAEDDGERAPLLVAQRHLRATDGLVEVDGAAAEGEGARHGLRPSAGAVLLVLVEEGELSIEL